ncbi:uncharacterized protein LOC112553006 [Pogonomyrmex barbatus]|uniref:Uncharacterized protein LOC112553006 n=1 Tax=Pogonomyrmex barbatus TaxID=144034 RepID=A0A8N1S9M2_9HYME|nr:uncharacterized protein LOC112553006 [Pogonomyrmex barbatus]
MLSYDLIITKTKRYSLKTQYFVECQMCHFQDNFWSEPMDDKILDVNRGDTILTGTAQAAEEFLAIVNVPCMSNKTYINYHNEMSEVFAAAAEEEMRVADEEEKRLAIERGNIIDGIVHIPIITGSWMKRSYQ